MNLTKPKAILFDWDNTLADTWPVIFGALTATFEKMGYAPWTLEETKQRVHRSLRDSFPEIFGEAWEEAGNFYLDHFKQHHLTNLSPIPAALDVLNQLKGSGIYLAVVSNKTGENLRKELAHLGWGHYFERVVGATDAVADKPNPAPVLMALEGSGITPDKHVWFIGDSITDMETAHNSGCLPIFFGDGDPTDDRFKHYPAHLHVKTHEELQELIRKIL